MIKAKAFIAVILTLGLLLVGLMVHGCTVQRTSRTNLLPAKQALVSRLLLTDFALWTEARYTRHPSQTDFFSAFQDFPGAPDHFPAGSILAPSHPAPGDRP